MDHETVDSKIKGAWSVCVPTRFTWSALRWYTWRVIDNIVSFMERESVDSKTKSTCGVCVHTSALQWCSWFVIDDIVSFMDCESVDKKQRAHVVFVCLQSSLAQPYSSVLGNCRCDGSSQCWQQETDPGYPQTLWSCWYVQHLMLSLSMHLLKVKKEDETAITCYLFVL